MAINRAAGARRSVMRHCAISRKAADSRPNEAKSFNLPNPSGSTRPCGLIRF
jgi:hypothetical protein